jgi:surfeit locus 1 family protein
MSAVKKILAILVLLISCAILVNLGLWQLQRKDQKETLITQIEAQATQAPVPLENVGESANLSYKRVVVEGVFLPQHELKMLAALKTGAAWVLLTPLRLNSGQLVFVLRGSQNVSAPLNAKAPEITMRFEAKIHLPERKNLFSPEHTATNIQKNEWYWLDLETMQKAFVQKYAAPNPPSFKSFFLEVEHTEATAQKAVYGSLNPASGAQLPPNNHLGYALTWLSLAGILALGLAAFLWHIFKKSP